jgi:hypothetical protein
MWITVVAGDGMRIAETALPGVLAGSVLLACVLMAGLAGPDGASAEQHKQPSDRTAAGNIAVVTTDGEASLKLCRDWLFRHECREYGHVDIPKRIAIGDAFEVTFGSNPKTMQFRVKSIMKENGGCLLVPAHEDMPRPSNGQPNPSAMAADQSIDMLIVKGCTVPR